MTITVRYRSIDRCSKTRKFKTLAGAQKFARKWVGKHPDIGSGYAVSCDGIGKVTVEGVSLAVLFEELPTDPEELAGRLLQLGDESGYQKVLRQNPELDPPPWAPRKA